MTTSLRCWTCGRPMHTPSRETQAGHGGGSMTYALDMDPFTHDEH